MIENTAKILECDEIQHNKLHRFATQSILLRDKNNLFSIKLWKKLYYL